MCASESSIPSKWIYIEHVQGVSTTKERKHCRVSRNERENRSSLRNNNQFEAQDLRKSIN